MTQRKEQESLNERRLEDYLGWLNRTLAYAREVDLKRQEQGEPRTTCRLLAVLGSSDVRVDLKAPEVRLSATVATVLDALDLISGLTPGGWEWEQWIIV